MERSSNAIFLNWRTAYQYGFYHSLSKKVAANATGFLRIGGQIMGGIAAAHYNLLSCFLRKVKGQLPPHSHLIYATEFIHYALSQCEIYHLEAKEALSAAKGPARIPNTYKYLHSVAYLHLACNWLRWNRRQPKPPPISVIHLLTIRAKDLQITL